MQWIKFNRADEFDYEVVSHEQFYLDDVINEKKGNNITIISDKIINETIIVEFSDGDVYSWCDEIFANIKNLDN
jgi:hypothetical protein